MSPSPITMLVLILGLGLVIGLVQVGLLTIAFDKLGLSPSSALLLLLVSLLGSFVNLPLFRLKSGPTPPPSQLPPPLQRLLRLPQWETRTLIALNVGGGLVPISFSAYLINYHTLDLLQVGLGTTAVTIISYLFSRPIPGLGIAMPVLIAPISAAVTAVVINSEQSAPLAYSCGTLGVLIGADLLRMKDVRNMGSPLAAIGGAGTFDGIFITGLVAVLLA